MIELTNNIRIFICFGDQIDLSDILQMEQIPPQECSLQPLDSNLSPSQSSSVIMASFKIAL